MANTNYNKMSTKDTKETTEKKSVKKQNKETKPKKVYGYVANCEKVNIRNKPNLTESEILVVVNAGTKVEINEGLSTDTFYSVVAHCPDEIQVIGYIMKDYVTVKQ